MRRFTVQMFLRRIAGVFTALVWVGPFRWIGFSNRIVKHVMGFPVAGAIFGVASRWLGKAARGIVLAFVGHRKSLPVASGGKSGPNKGAALSRLAVSHAGSPATGVTPGRVSDGSVMKVVVTGATALS